MVIEKILPVGGVWGTKEGRAATRIVAKKKKCATLA